jgi:UDP-2,3-diacylglucosamine pyrophosphatase LpxH
MQAARMARLRESDPAMSNISHARKIGIEQPRKSPSDWRRLTQFGRSDRPALAANDDGRRFDAGLARPASTTAIRVRSLFVSDLHLGACGARAREFLRFLRSLEAEVIYLVGDIFDVWHGDIKWAAAHDAILSELGRRAASGTTIVYLPGNHDSAMRNLVTGGVTGLRFDMFELADRATHVAADGRRYLVLHGDQCDARILKWHALTRWGNRLDGFCHRIDRTARRLLGRWTDRGLAYRCRKAMNALVLVGNEFEGRLVRLARDSGHHGVICGHYHRAASRDHAGIAYMNCGDWVDSLTGIVEHADGSFELVKWQSRRALRGAMA